MDTLTQNNDLPDNIFLVGPMGAGKTTIGRQLAKQLHRRFYDSDREIEKQTGVSIPIIFELEREEGFRLRETNMIDKLTQRHNIVLATGGGAVLNADNRTFLNTRGHVIYLHAPIERLLERTSRDQNRPLLQTADPRKTMESLMAIRDPLYRKVADTIIETNEQPIRSVVNMIIELLQHGNTQDQPT